MDDFRNHRHRCVHQRHTHHPVPHRRASRREKSLPGRHGRPHGRLHGLLRPELGWSRAGGGEQDQLVGSALVVFREEEELALYYAITLVRGIFV